MNADFLIVGSGIAGLRAAIALAPRGRVVVLTKAEPRAGSTGVAQGGIAAAVGRDDSPALHADDTMQAGDGLCDPGAVEVLTREGPAYVRELLEWGAAFDRGDDGELDLTREAAHRVRRVLHARDATGPEIGRVLAARVVAHPNVTVLDFATVVQVVIAGGRAAGVRYRTADGQLHEALGRATLLATGGAGRIYPDTTNPLVAAGDGVALAFLAGARVADMEFVQFHPTALSVPGHPSFLLSEALRGEGGRLINHAGEAFAARYDEAGDMAPRDRVARAMLSEMARTGHPVYLVMDRLPPDEVHARFPLIASLCAQAGLDLATDRLPVRPAAHYLMGGVWTDLDGRTTIRDLFAAGEVACTGVHGANRLASNSLLEGLVFGARAGAAMAMASPAGWPVPETDAVLAPPADGAAFQVGLDESTLTQLMAKGAGIFRDARGLGEALASLDRVWLDVDQATRVGRALDERAWRGVALVTVARLVVRAALRREESRGAHARTDFPDRDDLHWRRRLFDARSGDPLV